MNNYQNESYKKYQNKLRIYRILGIALLQKIIMGTIGKFVLLVNPREKMPSYFVGNPFKIDSLKTTLKWSYFNEVTHFSVIFICMAIGYYFSLRGYNDGMVFMTIFIFFNFGLILLQHFNRIRINYLISMIIIRNNLKPTIQ